MVAASSRTGKVFILSSLFSLYRNFIREFLKVFGYCGCRFVPSCSHYAEELLLQKSSFKHYARSFFRILFRISRCNAWSTPVICFDPPSEDYLLKHI